jgi:hypothetical protein
MDRLRVADRVTACGAVCERRASVIDAARTRGLGCGWLDAMDEGGTDAIRPAASGALAIGCMFTGMLAWPRLCIAIRLTLRARCGIHAA